MIMVTWRCGKSPEHYPDRRLATYGARAEHIQAFRARFADWRSALLRP
jgi:hypothetical protein